MTKADEVKSTYNEELLKRIPSASAYFQKMLERHLSQSVQNGTVDPLWANGLLGAMQKAAQDFDGTLAKIICTPVEDALVDTRISIPKEDKAGGV